MRLDEIIGERLILRELRLEDVVDVFEFTSQDEVTEFLSWPPHKEKAVTLNFLESVVIKYSTEAPSQWGISLKGSGKIVGISGFISLDSESGKGELAYLSSPNYAGLGYMTEANMLILNYAFETLQLNRVQAKSELNNIGSQRVLEKIGMKKEGTFKDFLKIKGTLRTYNYFAILKAEYLIKKLDGKKN